MSDQFDQAQASEARETALARKVQQVRAELEAKHAPQPTGECLNPLCGEPLQMVPNGDGELAMPLFCGPKCAKEHAKRVK